jgi:hypothetical protein
MRNLGRFQLADAKAILSPVYKMAVHEVVGYVLEISPLTVGSSSGIVVSYSPEIGVS